MKTRISRDVATAHRSVQPILRATGTAGWAQADADRARIRSVLRAPSDWSAAATTGQPASATSHGAARATANNVSIGGGALDPAVQAAPDCETNPAINSSAPVRNTLSQPPPAANAGLLLQRKCACGGGASGFAGECDARHEKKLMRLQTKLQINEPGDVYEQEADRVADQVLADPINSDVSSARPRIQRHSRSSNGQAHDAPPA